MRVLILRGLMIAMLTFVVSSGVAVAGPFEDAQAAYARGDYATALQLYKLLATGGNVGAQNDLGVMYEKGQGVPKDYGEAVKWFRKSAGQGNAYARSNLGAMFENGNGVPRDYKEAVKWYRLAAAQGYVTAQYNLGLMYEEGRGVPQDYKQAANWYRLAAEQGDAQAQMSLGAMYASGHGVRGDYDEAVKWYRLAATQYRLAAAQGDRAAQMSLGAMYASGHGVRQDYDEAVKWYRLAAAQGEADAQAQLGLMYRNGWGVPEDYVLSYMWLSVSNTFAALLTLQTLTTKITPAQIELAQKIARRCTESDYKQCGEPQGNQDSSSATSVPMRIEGGTYVIPVLINGAITLDFVVDSGAADVSIPADVVMTLMRTGTLKETDFLGEKTYVLADGSKVPSQTFRIRSLKVGNKVLENVNGSVASVQGSLLLGQAFLSRFKSWSVDNTKHALVLSE